MGHIAVDQGAAEGDSFVAYIDYLQTGGFTTPRMRTWVDRIRKAGNDATHKLASTTREDAANLMTFTEMLLRIVYEFPARAGNSTP